MGEKVYTILGRHGKYRLTFSAMDEGYGCLCTFPYNDAATGGLDRDRVRSLALFGAAVRLAWGGAIVTDESGYVFLPDAVPAWIRDEIDRVLEVEKDDEAGGECT